MAVGSLDSLAVAKQVPQSTIVSTVIFSRAVRISGTTQDHMEKAISKGQCFAPRIKEDKISAENDPLVQLIAFSCRTLQFESGQGNAVKVCIHQFFNLNSLITCTSLAAFVWVFDHSFQMFANVRSVETKFKVKK